MPSVLECAGDVGRRKEDMHILMNNIYLLFKFEYYAAKKRRISAARARGSRRRIADKHESRCSRPCSSSIKHKPCQEGVVSAKEPEGVVVFDGRL